MRKVSLFALALVLVVAAVFLAVAYDGNSAQALPDGWDVATCGACHNGSTAAVAPAAHTIPAHASIASNCAACHTGGVPPAIDISKCGGCHTAAQLLDAHGTSACGGNDCHGGVVTTTTAASTTTTVAPTTSTSTSTTSTSTTATTATTVPTTVTSGTTSTSTTSTTSTSTTSTTVRRGTIPVTG